MLYLLHKNYIMFLAELKLDHDTFQLQHHIFQYFFNEKCVSRYRTINFYFFDFSKLIAGLIILSSSLYLRIVSQ